MSSTHTHRRNSVMEGSEKASKISLVYKDAEVHASQVRKERSVAESRVSDEAAKKTSGFDILQENNHAAEESEATPVFKEHLSERERVDVLAEEYLSQSQVGAAAVFHATHPGMPTQIEALLMSKSNSVADDAFDSRAFIMFGFASAVAIHDFKQERSQEPTIDHASVGSLSANDSVNEGQNFILTVNLSNSNGNPAMTYSLRGTADVSDYDIGFSNGVTINNEGTLNIPAGVTSFTITVSPALDRFTEGAETLEFNIGGQNINGTINDTSTTPQPAGSPVIDLGSYGQMIHPIQVEGNWYYIWDRDANNVQDYRDAASMDSLEVITGIQNLTESENTFLLNGVGLRLPTDGLPGSSLMSDVGPPGTSWSNETSNWDTDPNSNPTYDDMSAIWDAFNGTGNWPEEFGLPPNWLNTSYWTSTPSLDGYVIYDFNLGYAVPVADSYSYIILQVM